MKLEQKARTSKKEWRWQRGIVEHLLSGSEWNREHFSVRKWESEKHKSWFMPAVAQLDYDEEMGLLHGMYGSMEAEFEVQRTIKRVELTSFLCFLRKVSGPIKVHVDNKGMIDGLRKGEKECIKNWRCRLVDKNSGRIA